MKEKIAGIAILANVFLAGGKVVAGFLSGSGAVFAEGLHSGVDILSSVISFLGIKISQKPVDKKHPYGHYKFEVMAGLLIAGILFFTGGFIVWEAIQELKNPSPVEIGGLVLGVMAVSALINEIMARLKIYYGKKESSVSLLSDGVHSRVDVFTSLAVFLGLVLTRFWSRIDSVLALLIGFYIIKESFSLGKEAADCLLDASAGEEKEKEIRELVKKEGIELAQLKTQKRGSVINANLEIKLPKNLSVEKASKIAESLREKLMAKISNLAYMAIQIGTHNLETGFYKPGGWFPGGFGRGFGWQGRGKFKEELKEARGRGPGGWCVCPQCGYKVVHQPGVPCASLQCPSCKISLERK